MSILSGFKKYKDYIKTSSGYQLASRWTSSDTVEMSNGKTLTNNIDTTLKVSGAFADAKAVGDAIANVAIETDTTLTVSGAAADAKTVGDKLAGISSPINSINMYYDPATDIKYLKNQDGEWVDVGYGGLLNVYLIDDGEINTDLVGEYNTSAGSIALTVVSENGYLSMTTANSGYWIRGLFNFTKAVDVTDKSKLCMTYNISSGAFTDGQIRMCISSSAPTAYNSDAIAYADILSKSEGVYTKSGTLTLDLTNISSSVYVWIVSDANYGNTSTGNWNLKITDMWLE